MWKVSKLHRGTEPLREAVAAEVHAALLRWYTGHGSDTDEAIGVDLVQQLRARNLWLACDCLGETVPPPLLSPAYMTEAQTHYLKRLTTAPRPAHKLTCPFHREQVLRSVEPQATGRLLRKPPEGFFAVLKPIGEHLAQRPEEDEPRVSRPSIPRLARLLWQLSELAGTTIIAAIEERPAPAIRLEFDKLRRAAQEVFIAPGIPLARLLFTHPSELHSKRIYVQLRAAAANWPSGSQPQAFLLTYANSIAGREIHFSKSDPVLVASPVKKLPGTESDIGPYLVLIAIGDHAPARGFAPVRAYAQPIQDGVRFVPVDTAEQRSLLAVLLQLQWALRADGVSTWIKRPLFNLDTDVGLYRPDFMLACDHRRGQRRTLHMIELGDEAADDEMPSPPTVFETPVDGVIRVAPKQLADTEGLKLAILRQLLGPTSPASVRSGAWPDNYASNR